jgi:hypothetical protein
MKRTVMAVALYRKTAEQFSHMIRRKPRKLSPASPRMKRANIWCCLSFGESAIMVRYVARLTADETAQSIPNKFITLILVLR